jgi:hypothetical protein
VLRRHDRALLDQTGEAGWMNAPRPPGIDAEGTDVVQPVQQLDHVGRRGRFRAVPQPGKSRPAERGVVGQQSEQGLSVNLREPGGKRLEAPAPGAHTRMEADTLQHMGARKRGVRAPQMVQHGPHDRLAAIRGPGRLRADLQAPAPGWQAEALEPKQGLQFGRMLPARLVARRVCREGGRVQPELIRYEGEEGSRQMLARPQTLARMTQQAELDGEAEPVGGAALGGDKRQVLGTENVVTCHLGAVDRYGEQPLALLGGQEGSDGQDRLVAKGQGRS